MLKIYHVLNRGVDKRKIFLDNQDHFRFIHDLYEFNDQDLINTTFHKFKRDIKNNVIGLRKIEKRRKLLVNVHAFCLMPNHYHLLLSERIKDGISKFMHKLNKGYSRYFNEKNKRQGTLFQGKYKSIILKNNSHFIHIPFYIHLNPLDLKTPEWRDRELKNLKTAVEFLESYRWSSYLDYIGKRNFPSVTQRELLMDFFQGPSEYRCRVIDWLKNFNENNIQDYTLD